MSTYMMARERRSAGSTHPAPDYIGRWKMDEGTGTSVADDSGNGLTGTANGSPAWQGGLIGDYCLNFDNSDDYVEVSDDDLLSFGDGVTDGPFSISVWFRANDINYGTLVMKGSNAEREYWLYFPSSGSQPRFVIGDGAGGQSFITASSAQSAWIGVWTHLVATYAGGGCSTTTMKMYANGSATAMSVTDNTSGTITGGTTHPFRIGTRWDVGTNVFDGEIDDVAIWDRVLTTDEIADLYAMRLKADPVSDYVSRWSMDEGTGTTAADSNTTNANDGTLINTPTWKTDGTIGDGTNLSFDSASSERVDISDTADLTFGDGSTDSAFSISMRVRFDDKATGTQGVIGKASGVSSGEWYILTSASQVFFRCVDNSAGAYIGKRNVTAGDIPDDEWGHLVVTYDGGGADTGIAMYWNNSSVLVTANNSGSYTAMEDTSNAIRIGSRGTSNYFNGDLADIRIYDRVLSAAEIEDLYNWVGAPA